MLERNGYTCQMCGIGASNLTEDGRKARLRVGHIVDRSHDGKNELSNLRALCMDCNQGAKNLVQQLPTWTWLLAQLRRATIDDQRVAIDWLKSKFGGTRHDGRAADGADEADGLSVELEETIPQHGEVTFAYNSLCKPVWMRSFRAMVFQIPARVDTIGPTPRSSAG